MASIIKSDTKEINVEQNGNDTTPQPSRCNIATSNELCKDGKRQVWLKTLTTPGSKSYPKPKTTFYLEANVPAEQGMKHPHYDVEGLHCINMTPSQVKYLASGRAFKTIFNKAVVGDLEITVTPECRCLCIQYTLRSGKHRIPIRLSPGDYTTFQRICDHVFYDLTVMAYYLRFWDGWYDYRIATEKDSIHQMLVAYFRKQFQSLNLEEQTVERATEIIKGLDPKSFESFLSHNGTSLPDPKWEIPGYVLECDVAADEVIEATQTISCAFLIHNSVCDRCSNREEYIKLLEFDTD